MTTFGMILEPSNFQAQIKQVLCFVLEMLFRFLRDYTPNSLSLKKTCLFQMVGEVLAFSFFFFFRFASMSDTIRKSENRFT